MKNKFKTFRCELTNYEIVYKICGDVAEVYDVKFDYKHMKPFCIILKESLDFLLNEKIKIIRQYVIIDDWLEFKDKTKWEVREFNHNYNNVMLECDICDYIYNFLIGLG